MLRFQGSGELSGEPSVGTGVSIPRKSWSGGGGHEGVMERVAARGLEVTRRLALGVTERLPKMLAIGEDARLASQDPASSKEVSRADDALPRNWCNVLPRVTRLCGCGGLMPADASATATREARICSATSSWIHRSLRVLCLFIVRSYADCSQDSVVDCELCSRALSSCSTSGLPRFTPKFCSWLGMSSLFTSTVGSVLLRALK